MQIPNHIDNLLNKRAKAASDFMMYDSEISEWLRINNIEVSPDDVLMGVCSLCEPYSSIDNIRECIKNRN